MNNNSIKISKSEVDGPIIQDSVVTGGIGNTTVDTTNLDKKCIEKIEELVNCLKNQSSYNDVSQSTVYEAVGKLLAIKEASEKQNQEEQAKAIKNWRKWYNSIGEKAQKYLSITADTVSLGVPLLKLLGLPIPF